MNVGNSDIAIYSMRDRPSLNKIPKPNIPMAHFTTTSNPGRLSRRKCKRTIYVDLRQVLTAAFLYLGIRGGSKAKKMSSLLHGTYLHI